MPAKRAALLLLIAGAARAQTPQIIEYPTAPEIKTARTGSLNCNFYGQYPTAGQAQVWCTIGGVTVYNGIAVVNQNVGVVCSVTSVPNQTVWAFIPATTANKIEFQIYTVGLPTTNPLIFGPLMVPSVGAGKAGTL